MERKYLKAIGIMNIILGILFIFTIFGIIPGVALLVNGIIFNNYSKLSDEELQTKKSYILIWSCILVILNTVGAILGFIAHDKLCMNPTKTNIKSSKKIVVDKQTKKIDLLLKLGVLMVGLAGLIFATTTWNNIGSTIKLIFLLIFSVFFFVLYFVSKKFIKIRSTEITYYILGWLFILFSIISVGYFGMFGIDSESDVYESVLFLVAGIGSFLSYKHFSNKPFLHISFGCVMVTLIDFLSIKPLNCLIALNLVLFISIVLSNILLSKKNQFYVDFDITRLILSFIIIGGIVLGDITGIDKIIGSTLIIFGSFIQLVRSNKTIDNIFFLILSYLLILVSFIPAVSLKEPLTYIAFAGTFTSIQLIELSLKDKKITVLVNEILTFIILMLLYFVTFNNVYGCYYLPLVISIFMLITHIVETFMYKENKVYQIIEPIKVGLLVGGIQFCLSKYIPTINSSNFVFITPLVLSIMGIIKKEKIYFIPVYILLLFIAISNNTTFITLIFSTIISILIYSYFYFTNDKNNIQVILYLAMLILTYSNLNTIGIVYNRSISSLLVCIALFIAYSLLTKNKWLKRVSYLLIILPYSNLADTLSVDHENISFVLNHFMALFYSLIIATFINRDSDKKIFILITVGLNILSMIISDNLISGILAGILSLGCIYFGFFKEKYSALYKMGIILGLLNIVIKFKSLWYEIPFWCYLLIGGLIIIGFATYKQIKNQKK